LVARRPLRGATQPFMYTNFKILRPQLPVLCLSRKRQEKSYTDVCPDNYDACTEDR